MNKPVVDNRLQYEVQFERAKFRTSEGRNIDAKKVILDFDSRTLRYIQDKEIKSFDLSSITNLKYSNTDLGVFGSMFGGALGISIALILTDGGSSNNSGGDAFTGFDGLGRALAVTVALPLGIILGKQIGEEYNIKWRDYPLNRNDALPLPAFPGPPSKTTSLGWKIPLKW